MSTIVDPIAQALADIAEGLAVTPTIKTHKWGPRDLAQLPACVISLPRISRRGIEEPESQLGSDDWTSIFPALFYFDLSVAESAQVRALDVVEAWIRAVDDNPDLDGTCLEAKVIEAEPKVMEQKQKPMLVYETSVETLALPASQ